MNMSQLEDYEVGTLQVKVRKRWYQFWLPKYVLYGHYTKIGKIVKVILLPNLYAGLVLKGTVNE